MRQLLVALAVIAAILLLAFSLTGQQKFRDFGKCRLMALKEVKNIQDGDVAFGKAGDFTMLCMEAKGYDVDWQAGGCRVSASAATDEKDCYYRRWF